MPDDPGQRLMLPDRLMSRWVGVACAVLVGIIVVRASSIDLTWDETYSFLNFSRSWDGFADLRYPTNHPLNSLLVWIATRALGVTSEFALRLPNVLAGVLYLWATARLVRGVRPKLFAFSLCALQTFTITYFAIARGYGLSVALVQLGLVEYFFMPPRERSYPLTLGAFFLASLAVYSTFIVSLAFVGANAVDWGRRRLLGDRTQALRPFVTLGFLGLSAVPVGCLLWVTRPGRPNAGIDANFFVAVPEAVVRVYLSDNRSWWLALVGLGCVAALLVMVRRCASRRTAVLLVCSALVLVLVYASSKVGPKAMPPMRVVLPYVPVWVLTVISMVEDICTRVELRLRRPVERLSWVASGILALMFVHHLDFARFTDLDYHVQRNYARDLVLKHCLSPETDQSYGRYYYAYRWFGNTVPPLPPCR